LSKLIGLCRIGFWTGADNLLLCRRPPFLSNSLSAWRSSASLNSRASSPRCSTASDQLLDRCCSDTVRSIALFIGIADVEEWRVAGGVNVPLDSLLSLLDSRSGEVGLENALEDLGDNGTL
jgi:hypothetical protein